jgi:hypothetical protein|tara:strand:- start:2294 stop:2707 length:414 start_codon:yes stop_codon:yes gene_type:complete
MSSFYKILHTFAKAVDDLSLGITVVQDNDNFTPPDDGQWAVLSMIPLPVVSGMKGATVSMDVNEGIMQISLFDSVVGGMAKTLLDIADTIAATLTHGTTFTDFEDVIIQSTSINQGRIVGGFWQLDVSVTYTSYVDR